MASAAGAAPVAITDAKDEHGRRRGRTGYLLLLPAAIWLGLFLALVNLDVQWMRENFRYIAGGLVFTILLALGAIVLAVLSQLADEQYGYSLKKLLAEAGFAVEEGTLYPLLRRLESQGLLKSRWRLEDSRPRRYYKISAQGEKTLEALAAEWRAIAESIGRLLQ